MLQECNKFVVKSQSVGFSGKKSFEIYHGDTSQLLATAKDATPFFPSLFGSTTIEIRDVSGTLIFSLMRTGWLFKSDQVVNGQGEIVGRYKAKVFSLSSGFHIYDKAGKHLGEIQGAMFKAEYKFLTPEKVEMGKVSRTWGGMAESLFTGGGTYGVIVDPKFSNDTAAKMLMLGATIAVETIFKKAGSKDDSEESSSSSSDD